MRRRGDGMRAGTRREPGDHVEPEDELAGESRIGVGDVTDSTHPLVCIIEIPSELPHQVKDDER
jgi:hypothetical protein